MGKNSLVLVGVFPTYDFYLVNFIDKHRCISQMVDFKRVVLISMAIVVAALHYRLYYFTTVDKVINPAGQQISGMTANNFDNYIR